MSFQQGLSGLNGAAKSLDVIGNNIANASTVGFKGSTTQFADVYARSLNGAGGNTAGIGVSVAGIAQQFTQGNIETSNNPLDIAINGSGFFRTESAGLVTYTRNGQFSLDKSGYIVTPQGAKLTGYGVGSNNQILAGTPQALKIDTTDLKPIATTKVDTQMQLDSRATVPTKTPFESNLRVATGTPGTETAPAMSESIWSGVNPGLLPAVDAAALIAATVASLAPAALAAAATASPAAVA
jgi:flagellar hook protein FlgE